jgi:hypothetical protein
MRSGSGGPPEAAPGMPAGAAPPGLPGGWPGCPGANGFGWPGGGWLSNYPLPPQWAIALAWWLAHQPWSATVIIPLPGEDIGPAFTILADPADRFRCGGFGVGISEGRNASLGPAIPLAAGHHATPQQARAIFSGWSVSVGGNLPTGGFPAGIGAQVGGNGSGIFVGPTFGMFGISGSITYSWCTGRG